MEPGGAFAVVDLESGRIIGSSGYYKYKSATREVVMDIRSLRKP
jgi:hypothetical protein